MSAVPARPVSRRGRRLAALVAALAVLGAASPAHADQIVRFDDAGDAPHISLIGDSTLSGVRWYADYGELREYNFVLNAESCRRTFETSCISREGYRSENVITAMGTLNGELGEVLVVMSGYNDPADSIDDAIDGVVDEARRQDVERVVWLSLRTSSDVDYSDPQEQTSINTFREYNERLHEAAAGSDGYLQVADWATYSNGASGWFEYDGVHLTPRGVDAVTTFIAGIVGRVLAGEDVSPAAAPWTVLVPGAEGDRVRAVQDALVAAGIELAGGVDGVYGNDTMASVAAYQRANDLQVTGAVDLATARSLGVLDEPVDADVTTTTATAPATAAPSSAAVRAAPTAAPLDADRDDGLPRWLLAAGAVSLALAAGVVGRRRYVMAQRAARRWGRVHPSTSPLRSVADLRRTGELPATPVRIYDQFDELATADAADGQG